MELLLSAAGDAGGEDALCGGVARAPEPRAPRGEELDALVRECVARSRGAPCLHGSLSGSNGADPRLVESRNSAYARFLRRAAPREAGGAGEARGPGAPGGPAASGRVRHPAAGPAPGDSLRPSDLEDSAPARRPAGSLAPAALGESLRCRAEVERARGAPRAVDNLQALLYVARALMCCGCHARRVEERLRPGETHYLVLGEGLEYRGLARLGADGSLHRVLGLLDEPASVRPSRVAATAVLDGGLLRLAGPALGPRTVGVVLAPPAPGASAEGGRA